MSARDDVLARVRRALGGGRADPAVIRAEADALVGDLAAIRPAVGDTGALARFTEKATSERVTATVEQVPAPEALPARVRAYLDAHGLAPELAAALPPVLAGLDWRGLALTDAIAPNETVALTYADAAVAETGTLVFASSPTVPTLFNFLPLHHLAVVRAEDVLPYMEDVWQRFPPGRLPRSLNLVTGTSGTADIEGQNIRGAHGPRHLHILVLERP
jgi:L-lactate dehydrogenase complex protein LldG